MRRGEDVVAGFQAVVPGDLFGPGEGVRSEDHVIEFQQRILRIDGFLFKDVDAVRMERQRGSGAPMFRPIRCFIRD